MESRDESYFTNKIRARGMSFATGLEAIRKGDEQGC